MASLYGRKQIEFLLVLFCISSFLGAYLGERQMDSSENGKRKNPPEASREAQDVFEQRTRGELFSSIHELSRLISTYFDTAMSAHHMTHAQWWALMHISAHEGATQIELAAYFQMGRASAGKLLERLEAKNWIERRPDAQDGRIRRVYLRSAAQSILQLMQHEGTRLFDDFLKDISPEDERALLLGLRKIKNNAETLLSTN